MLVMTRRPGEEILLGDDVRIIILSVDADRVKIGIEAPGSTKILRGELLAAVRDLNREATQGAVAFAQGLGPVLEASQPSLDAKHPATAKEQDVAKAAVVTELPEL